MRVILGLVFGASLLACGSSKSGGGGGKVDGTVTIGGAAAKFGGCTKVGDKWRFPIGDSLTFVVDVMNGNVFEKAGKTSPVSCGEADFESSNRTGTMKYKCGSPDGEVVIDAKFDCE